MDGTPVVVVGAGVMGLSAGIRLAEAGYRVEVLAREMPLETTSSLAAAMWYPYRIEPVRRAYGWAGRSFKEFNRLAADAGAGIVLRPGTELLRHPTPAPWWSSLVPELTRPSAVPPPYRDGWSFVTPVIEMPTYLAWLQARLESLGGSLRRVDLVNLPDDAEIVVNCSGLGARSLVGDLAVTPVRGQVLVMTQVGVESWMLDGAGLTYVIPRSHDIVVGGTDDEGSWDTSVDLGDAAQLLGRATALEPLLAGAEIVTHKVGLRPARPQARLEAEQVAPDRSIVHCYGHGGAGVTVSWGCADEVVSVVREELARLGSTLLD